MSLALHVQKVYTTPIIDYYWEKMYVGAITLYAVRTNLK